MIFNKWRKKRVDNAFDEAIMSDDQLREEAESYIEIYAKFNLDGIPCKHDHLDMHEETVLARDSIYNLLEEMNRRNLEFSTERIVQLDAEWQEFMLKNKENDFKLVDLNRDEIPRNLWWFWVDELETLTPEQRSTI